MSVTGRARRTRNTHGKGAFRAGLGKERDLHPRSLRRRRSRDGQASGSHGKAASGGAGCGHCPRGARSPRASPPPGGRPLPAPGAPPGAALLLSVPPRRLRRWERGFSGRRGNVALGAAGAAGAAGPPPAAPPRAGRPAPRPPRPGRGHLAPAHLSRPRNFPRAARFERGCAERDPRGSRGGAAGRSAPRPPRTGPARTAPSASARGRGGSTAAPLAALRPRRVRPGAVGTAGRQHPRPQPPSAEV